MRDIKSKTPCYCGKQLELLEKMVGCVKCRRWLHAGCVKSLGETVLFGDKFYILVCSVCNSGSECLARLEFTWTELIQLVLYHLTIQHQQKYFHLDHEILPFFVENWNKLHLFGSVLTTKKEDKRNTIVQVLLNNSSKFKNGKEIKKSKYIWALRVKEPPEPPPVHPSSAKLHNDTVIWEFQVKDKKYHLLNKNVQKVSRNNSKTGKTKSKLTINGSSSNKKNLVSKCRGGLPYNENGVHKTKNKTKQLTTAIFHEESAQKGLLDSLIPCPPDFQNFNNPFWKSNGNLDKKSTSQSETKVRKRRWNGDLACSEAPQKNGDSQLSEVPPSNFRKKNSIFNAKDIFSHNSEKNVKISFSVLGKRKTSYGEIQYLFQKNREIKEPVAGKKLTQIKILCKCPNCKLLE